MIFKNPLLRFKTMKIIYAATMTVNSPRPTVNAENQYGSPKKVNSQATIKALLITGKTAANKSHLLNMMPKQAINVAAVPNNISKLAVGDKQFAKKQPIVNPTEYLLLKKHNKTIISEKRN